MLKVTVTSVLVDDQSCRRGGVGRFAAPSEKHLFHGGSNGMRIKANLTTLLSCLIFATPALATENTYIAAESIPFRSEEHTSELQSLMRISYAVFCLKKNNTTTT